MDWKYLLTSFEGRINRARFWAGIGMFIVIAIVAFILDSILGTRFTTASGSQVGVVGILVALASIYFAIALCWLPSSRLSRSIASRWCRKAPPRATCGRSSSSSPSSDRCGRTSCWR